MNEQQIKSWFAYNAPSTEQVAAMQQFRDTAGRLAAEFCAESQAGPDQTLALRKLKETLMAMNAALVSPTPRTY
ncbi:MAG: DUF7681 family protein [Janthinobacterium lividum]